MQLFSKHITEFCLGKHMTIQLDKEENKELLRMLFSPKNMLVI